MTTRSLRLPALLLLAATTVLGAAAAAGQNGTVLGDNGTLYRVQAGTYGELFPGGNATSADNGVLKLVIDRGDLGVEEHLVPGTADDAIEVGPSLVAESGSGEIHLIWESWTNILHSSIHLIGFGQGGWSEPIEITGAPFVLKSSPRLLVTRDEISLPDGNGGRTSQQRAILHLAWVEDAATDDERIMYAPLLLLDGHHAASGEPIALNELAPPLEEAGRATETFNLGEPFLGLRAGDDSRSVVIVFSDRSTNRVISLAMRVLPGEISFVADQLHDLLAAQPASALTSSQGFAALADLARRNVEETGSALQPFVRRELAEETHRFLSEHAVGTTPNQLAAESRDQVLGTGIDLTDPGVQYVTGRRRPHWVDFGYRAPRPDKPGTAEQNHASSYQVVSQVAAERPAPAAVQKDGVELLVSVSGEALAILWPGEEALFYQETESATGTWSQTNRLRLDTAIGADAARQMVQDRLDMK